MRFFPLAAIAAASFAMHSALAYDSNDVSIVQTPLGPVQGIVGDSFRVFMGVPYAAPPVADLRWRDPQPVAAWGPTVLQAVHDPLACMQVCVDDEPPHICPPPAKQSEDCLYVNIWTPLPASTPSSTGTDGKKDAKEDGKEAQTGGLPVVIFLHGGNFHSGSAGGLDPDGGLLYDGRDFVNLTNTIMVVANYRLGAFGFLFLEDDGPDSVHGNFGLEDQVQVMRWVRDNIAAFGGDPSRVTLQGQSAGAMSISCHMSRPQTDGLYVGGIMMSNPFAEAYRPPSSAQELASVLSNYTGCPSSMSNISAVEECLRGKDSATILAAQHLSETNLLPDLTNLLQIVVAWGPTIGTTYLPQRPLAAFQAGNVLDLPIMVGTTKEEAVIFIYEALDFPLTQDLYAILGPVLIGGEAYKQSLAPDLYPLPNPPPADGDLRVFAASVFTDGLFLCPTRNATEALQAAQPYRRSPIYLWQYSHLLSWGKNAWGSNFTECIDHVCHGSDLPMWWHPNEPALGANFTQQETDLSQDMEWYYANFAATGNPGSGSPQRPFAWPAYTAGSGPSDRLTMNLEVEPTGKTLLQANRGHWCDWWDTIGYNVY